MSANEPTTRGGILLIRHAHHPCRGGWFNKCQTLSYLVLAYGSHHDAIQQCGALYYAGPEKLEPRFEGMDEDLEADADEGDGGDEEEEDEEEEGEEGELPELQLDCTRHLVTSYSSS